MSLEDFEPVPDGAPAAWLFEVEPPRDLRVRTVVGPSFEAYARILHPARRPETGELDLRWSEVAQANGSTAHRLMQFHRLLRDQGSQTEVPRNGVMPEVTCNGLVRVLTPFAAPDTECYAAMWDGYGWLGLKPGAMVMLRSGRQPPDGTHGAGALRPALARAARLHGRTRDYLLLRGRLDSVPGWYEGPNLWWPRNRNWLVASDIDLPYTYVGGREEVIHAVLSSPDLEAYPALGEDDISVQSDTINPE